LNSFPTESEGNADDAFRAGFIAVVGRPNVGKSTLLNRIMDTKLAAVSPRPQTTHVRILGVLNREAYQAAFLDTPGYIGRGRDEMDRRMSQEGARALEEADVAVLVVEPRTPGDVERYFAEDLVRRGIPAIVAINKVDSVAKSALLPVIEAYSRLDAFVEIVPISAMRSDGIGLLMELVVGRLPEAAPMFPPDQITDRSERFRVIEMVREKLFRLFWQELPYATAVTIDEWVDESTNHGGKTHIAIRIHPEKDSQRLILLGKGGLALKEVGVQARGDIETLLGKQIFLELWVKARPQWRRDPAFLRQLGMAD
jgi:GTP-binding protein Era